MNYDRQADRGVHGEVNFIRCARGFLITTGGPHSGMLGTLYAFDHIEDVAAWFVEQYANPPEDAAVKAEDRP